VSSGVGEGPDEHEGWTTGWAVGSQSALPPVCG
jgi:hypothetical protein